MNDMRDLYQQLILDHYQNPRNKGHIDEATTSAQGKNPLCGDEIDVSLLIGDESIDDIKFEGTGCAISQASASIMTTVLKGKTVAESRELVGKFSAMVTEGKDNADGLGKLAALADIHKFPARVKCAMLSWRALEASLDHRDEAISTE